MKSSLKFAVTLSRDNPFTRRLRQEEGRRQNSTAATAGRTYGHADG
jgi:hypothetical protein